MHVRKLPSGNWNVVAYAGYDRKTGKKYRKSFTGKDLKAVKAEAAAWEAERKLSSDALGVAMEKFINGNEKMLSPTTVNGYNAVMHVLRDRHAWFYAMPLHRIGTAELTRLVNEMDGSPKTVRNRLGLISAAMKASGYTMPQVRTPQVPVPDLRIPDSDVVRKTIAAARETDPELWVCIMLAATGPLRAGEIAALSIDDLNGTMLHVHHSLAMGPDWRYHEKAPKTRSSDRYIDIPPELADAIRGQGYVTHWTPQRIARRFRALLRDNNIPPYRFHDLRHFAISEMLSQGIEEIYIAERSGHADYATMKRYTHALGNHRTEITRRINENFQTLFQTDA